MPKKRSAKLQEITVWLYPKAYVSLQEYLREHGAYRSLSDVCRHAINRLIMMGNSDSDRVLHGLNSQTYQIKRLGQRLDLLSEINVHHVTYFFLLWPEFSQEEKPEAIARWRSVTAKFQRAFADRLSRNGSLRTILPFMTAALEKAVEASEHKVRRAQTKQHQNDRTTMEQDKPTGMKGTNSQTETSSIEQEPPRERRIVPKKEESVAELLQMAQENEGFCRILLARTERQWSFAVNDAEVEVRKLMAAREAQQLKENEEAFARFMQASNAERVRLLRETGRLPRGATGRRSKEEIARKIEQISKQQKEAVKSYTANSRLSHQEQDQAQLCRTALSAAQKRGPEVFELLEGLRRIQQKWDVHPRRERR
jgi:hypothetical protein